MTAQPLPLRISVLGELQVEVDGRPWAPPTSQRARALLGYLALRPGPLRRGDVAAALWPDVLETSARGSLRSALWALRRGIGRAAEDRLITTRAEVGLVDDSMLWIDLRAFSEAARAPRRIPTPSSAPLRSQTAIRSSRSRRFARSRAARIRPRGWARWYARRSGDSAPKRRTSRSWWRSQAAVSAAASSWSSARRTRRRSRSRSRSARNTNDLTIGPNLQPIAAAASAAVRAPAGDSMAAGVLIG